MSTDRRELAYAGYPYFDSTRALERGEVSPAGYTLSFEAVEDTSELFRRMANAADVDASEMSLSTYMLLRARGDERLIAIPVFPSRSFRHSQLYVNANSGIAAPADLRGRRVGIPHYQMTSALWIRGFLQHDYGVTPQQVSWHTGGLTRPEYHERLAHAVPGVTVQRIPADRSLEQMLEHGELDALIGAQTPGAFGYGVRRLFSDHRAVEREYLRRTGFIPIMHTVVLRHEVYERDPAIAVALVEAFERSRRDARRRIASMDVLTVMHPWLAEELDALDELVGADLFAYGVAPNRRALETATALSYEQGLSRRRLDVEELFAPETLNWSPDPAL